MNFRSLLMLFHKTLPMVVAYFLLVFSIIFCLIYSSMQMSSAAGKAPAPGQAVYSASKFALNGYFHSLRSEVNMGLDLHKNRECDLYNALNLLRLFLFAVSKI